MLTPPQKFKKMCVPNGVLTLSGSSFVRYAAALARNLFLHSVAVLALNRPIWGHGSIWRARYI